MKFIAILITFFCCKCIRQDKNSDEVEKFHYIEIGARVVRGDDWKWSNQDNHQGGTVIDIRPWEGEESRTRVAVQVKWDNGNINSYRWGAEGAYDLKVIKNPTHFEIEEAKKLKPKRESYEPLPKEELKALYDFYYSLNGNNWLDNKGWLNSDPCKTDWTGVLCIKNHIFGISLPNNKLIGRIPDSISLLSHLSTIYLPYNKIQSPLPSTLKDLINLRWLSIANNNLTGNLPIELSSLPLEWIELNHNKFTGKIPRELGEIKTLKTLLLNNNKLDPPIPDEFFNHNNLTQLGIQGNPRLNQYVGRELKNKRK